MADRSFADWTYTVSEAVASYSLTGIIGFIVVKRLRLQNRLATMTWPEFGTLILPPVVFLLLLFGAGLYFGNYLGSAPAK